MIVAEGEVANAAGWVTAAVAILSAVGSLVVLLMNTRHRNKQEADASALTPLREALAHQGETLDRFQRELEKREGHIRELDQAFDQASEEHAQCQVTVSELYGALVLQHDYVKRLGAICVRNGDDPGELPKLPPKPKKPDRVALEFRARTLKQQTISIAESSAIIPKSPPTPGASPT